MKKLQQLEWIQELVPLNKKQLAHMDDSRIVNLIVIKIIKLIETNKMDRIIFYITEMIYNELITAVYMKQIITAICNNNKYKILAYGFKYKLFPYGTSYFVIASACMKDDIKMIRAVIDTHMTDFLNMLDIIYTAISYKAEKIVMYLLINHHSCTDDIVVTCIDMHMYDTIKCIINLGTITYINDIFTALCSVNNLSLIKLYYMIYPNVKMNDGLNIATMNNYTDIVDFINIVTPNANINDVAPQNPAP